MLGRNWIGFALAALVAGGAYAAAEYGVENLEPRVNREPFAALLDGLEIDDDGRMIADLLFSDYVSGLEAIAARIDEAQRAAGRDQLEQALSGRMVLTRDELRELRADVREVERGAFAESEQLAEELFVSIRDVLATDAAAFDRSALAVRRDMHLAPRRMRRGDSSYAGDGLDLVRLVTEARAGGELESVPTGQIDQLLDQYAASLDALLRDSARLWWNARLEAAVGGILDEIDLKADAEADIAREWNRHWALTNQYAEQIVTAAGDAGPAFRARFLAAAFPWLLSDTKPDRVNAWIQDRIADGETRASAAAIMDEYRVGRQPLVADAIDIIVRSRAEHSVLLDARMDPLALGGRLRDLYQELLRNSGRRASVESDATASLEALLTQRERRQMQADLAAAAFGRRR